MSRPTKPVVAAMWSGALWGWAWMRPAKRYDEYKDLVAAAEEELAEARAADVLGERDLAGSRQP